MPSETIELKIEAPRLTDDRFERAVSAFFDLLHSVTDNVVGRERAVRWIVEVESGSAIVRARPEADAEAWALVPSSIEAICGGIVALANRANSAPPYFTNVSLKAARSLASVRDPGGEYVSGVSLRNGSLPIDVTSEIVSVVDEILGEKYEALGSVEGTLQTISERHGFRLAVYDIIFDQPVICFPKDEEVKNDAMRAFGKRVIVAGEVRYRKDGMPSSVLVESIQTFLDDDDLPTAQDIQRIYAAI